MMSNNGINFTPLWNNGPAPGNFYNFPQNQVKSNSVDDFGVQRNA